MRVTLRPPSDCTLLDSMVGLEEKLVYGHVTGNPQEQEERDGNGSQPVTWKVYVWIYTDT